MRRPPRKNPFSYLAPFLVLGIIVLGLIYGLSNFGALQFGAGSPAQLQVETEDVQVMIKNSDTWRSVPQNVKVQLFRGDAIATARTGTARVQLLKDSFIYLDSNGSLEIINLEESEVYQKTDLQLGNGKSLVSVDRILHPKSEFSLEKGGKTFSSRGSVFILDDQLLQVLKGSVKVTATIDGKTEKSIEVGIGQELALHEPDFGVFNEVTIVPAEVYASPWLELALGKAGRTEEVSAPVITEEDTVIDEETEDETSVVTEEDSEVPTENTSNIEQIEPMEDGGYEVQGSVSPNAVKVSVNDYTLSQFKQGDTVWIYRAKVAYGNLEVGENTYDVTVTFADGKEISESFSIEYTPEETSTETDETADSSEETTEELPVVEENSDDSSEDAPEETVTSNTTNLAVLSPQEGARVADKTVTIYGTAPEGTTKIVINDYALKTYVPGEQWKYRASELYGNLEPGQENSYLITAYNADDEEIAAITFTFFSTAE